MPSEDIVFLEARWVNNNSNKVILNNNRNVNRNMTVNRREATSNHVPSDVTMHVRAYLTYKDTLNMLMMYVFLQEP